MGEGPLVCCMAEVSAEEAKHLKLTLLQREEKHILGELAKLEGKSPDVGPEPEPETQPADAASLDAHRAVTAKKGKQLSRDQIRKMVPIQLQIDDKDPKVSVEYIDALFDEFDADNNNTIDDEEWENIVEVLRRP